MPFFRRLSPIVASLLLVAALALPAAAGPKKVYLVNGLFSKAFGYGLTNLSKKIPYARHFKFSGAVTSAAINGIIQDAARAYKNDPTTEISLVGISQGANAITRIAAALDKQGVRVHYVAAIEGGTMTPLPSNVTKADSFICNGGDCARKTVRLATGNTTTRTAVFELDAGHIASGNDARMHSRVISQINSG
ncbi:MAG: hypothetical protein KDJ80_04985 [Nitratireductor sp.]|nr:hypothetical protein [Nitratireductor sp.]